MHRVAILASAVLLLLFGGAAPVFAATAPSNDDYAARVVVTSLPFVDTVDTTEATSEPLDTEAAAGCGEPPTDASIWYELTPSADGTVIIDASNADYSTGIVVVTGTPGAFVLENCAAVGLAMSVIAGATYGIVIFDYQGDGGGNGGTVTVAIGDAPPAPTIDMTVDGSGSFDAKTGLATIRGTVTCTGDAGKTFIDVQVTQAIGRLKIHGGGISEFACDGTSHAWSAVVFSDDGKFAGGKAIVTAYAVGCGQVDCASDQVENATVRLRK